MCEGAPISSRDAGPRPPASQPSHVAPALSAVSAAAAQPSAPNGAPTEQMSAASEPPLSLLELLQAFFEAQDVRARTYQRLHAGFRSFLGDHNEAAYRCARGKCRSSGSERAC